MATVVLAFPPLVEMNFGEIYPSTAVLAAYLEPRGFGAVQVDLNARFLDHILSDEELTASSEGIYSRSRPSSLAAARWTRRSLKHGSLSRSDLIAAQGHAKHPLTNILRLLASPYSVDPDERVLDGLTDDRLLLASYSRFFKAHLQDLVPEGSEDTLLGLSVPMGPQLLPTLLLASIVRAATEHPVCRIVLGGPSLSLLGEPELARLLEHHSAVDCIVRFDGERTLSALAEQFAAGEWAPHELPGTSSSRDHVATHVAPEPGPKLNTLPTPIYTREMIASAPNAMLGVTQARGCYWGKCDYCDFVEVYKGSPSYRGRRAELVVEDIRQLVMQTGLRRYRVITESIPPAFANHFSQLLCESDLAIGWTSFAMVDRRFDADLLWRMAASGCKYLVIGLESMVTRVLQLVHKSADREENFRFLTDARAAGIRMHVNLIPNLPTTTREEALQGLRDLEALADCIDVVKIFDFEPTRSSRVGHSPSSFGLTRLERVTRVGQAQLAINTLPAKDPAMTDSEREATFRDYRAFAARVNAGDRPSVDGTDHRRYIDVLDAPEGLLLTDFVTMERHRFPPRLRGAIAATKR
ncbi:MAG: B12-binding domain-containing radical SAM protein [Acidimicrobiia bacterium]